MPWFNGTLAVFHGTDDAVVPAASKVRLHNRVSGWQVNLTRCRPFTEFGQGFYVTTSEHQAQQWANQRVLRSSVTPGARHPTAVVLSFQLDRDWLGTLEALTFVRPINDFWDLVQACRNGFPPHQRSPPYNRCYDVVYGPVTLWPQRLVIQDCDQISFHSQRAVRGLPTPRVSARGSRPRGLI